MTILNPHIYGELIYNKAGKNLQQREDVSSVRVLEKLDSYTSENGVRPL